MSSVITILKEQFKNFYLINRLAQFQVKIANTDNYLGLAWEIINPMIQISVYWFVFGLGIRGNREMDGVPFIVWMLVGISMWFFINQGILEGTKSISSKYNMVSKMNFPLSILPSYILMSKFYSHLVILFIVIIMCMFFGIFPTWYTLQLLIYTPIVFLFSLSVTMLTSTLSVLIRDVQMAVQALLRVLFYMSPILWLPTPDNELMEKVLFIMKINPVYFLTESYRAAILYQNIYIIEHWQLAVYNLALMMIIFIIGSILHVNFRSRFSDFL